MFQAISIRNVLQLLTLILTVQVTGQTKRIALVIGNAAYEHGGVLKNPVNDAELMIQTLDELGFEVISRTDANLGDMQDAFKEFARKLQQNDVALFYYAGHGMQIGGENYLIPVDAKMEDQVSVDFEAFKVNQVNKFFAYNADKLNIMILDACRNNPYRSWMRSGATGFSAVQNQAAGTIIAFATREGETASDGSGSNGLFTEHLVKQMRIKQNITSVFQNTRVAVLEASRSQQVPQEWNMLTGDFYFTTVNAQTSEPVDLKTPSLAQGDVVAKYGSISIDSDYDGELYIDGNSVGQIQGNSVGNELNNITAGRHVIKIVGPETQEVELDVYEGEQSRYEFKRTIIKKKKVEKFSSFVDSRDGQEYRTVRLGSLRWMGEYLNHEVAFENPSWPTNILNENNVRLYNWKSAENACPEGWRLPTKADFNSLIAEAGGNNTASFSLKSTEGWGRHSMDGGTNFSGIGMKPTGYFQDFDGQYHFELKESAVLWGSEVQENYFRTGLRVGPHKVVNQWSGGKEVSPPHGGLKEIGTNLSFVKLYTDEYFFACLCVKDEE